MKRPARCLRAHMWYRAHALFCHLDPQSGSHPPADPTASSMPATLGARRSSWSAARRPGTIGGTRPMSPWRTGCMTTIWPSSGKKVNAPMAKNVKDLQAKMSPESRARSEAKAECLIQEMALDELRAARALTQEHLSTILGVQQSAISKLERRADMYGGVPCGISSKRWAGSSRFGPCFPTAMSVFPNFKRSRSRGPSGTRTPPRAPRNRGL